MTEDRWSRFLCENYRVTYPYRIMTVSQLPHIMERQNIYISMFAGGHYAMFGGDPSELIDVMKHYRPSEITVVPRFFQSLHASYLADLKLLMADQKILSVPPSRSLSMCNRSHLLVKENLNDFGYADGYECDRCHITYPCDLRWRCNACSFDVCPHCLPFDQTESETDLPTNEDHASLSRSDRSSPLSSSLLSSCSPSPLLDVPSPPPPTSSTKAARLLGTIDPSLQARREIEAIEAPLMQKYREMLGGNIQYVGIGGALSAKPMRDWIEQCFNCVVLDGYGATEVGGISTENMVDSSTQVRLESEPELGYTVDDLPYPRGQILVKTELSVPGYYNDPDATREAFTEDGFWRSGDIGEMRPNGELVIIDRVKSVFKLSQGEYIAPEPLEQLFCQSPLISQCFIYGQPQWDHLVAVVVPQLATLRANPRVQTLAGLSDQQLIAHPLSKEVVLQELRSRATQSQLAAYKIPKEVLLDPLAFTFERGFLTASMKYRRAELVKYYAPLFSDLLQENSPNHHPSSASATELSTTRLIELIDACHQAVLGDLVQCMAQLDRHLGMLSTVAFDSLQNMQIVLTLRAHYHASLEVRDFVNADARMLCALLQNPASLSPELTRASFIADWERTCFITDSERTCSITDSERTCSITDSERSFFSDSVSCQSLHQRPDQNFVLVTGATGAIGTQLMIHLLLALRSTPVIGIVRARDDVQAMDRMRRCLLQGGMTLEALAGVESRLRILAGDVALPRLGLPEATYASLQAQVGLVYHLAAHVNWNLSYEALRETNVVGTFHVVDFCLHAPQPSQLIHVSTASVAESMTLDGPSRVDLTSSLSLDGYTQSKLIAERYVAQQVSTDGLLATIVRPAMITGHSTTGLNNLTDFVPRFLVGIAQLRCYPIGTLKKQDMYPVDHLVQILTKFATQSSPMHPGQVLAIADDDPVSFDEIGRLTNEFFLKHRPSQPPLQPIQYQEFYQRLLLAPSNPLFPFLSTLFDSHDFHAGLDDHQSFAFFKVSSSSILPPKEILIENYLMKLFNE